ncbi:hypothetical protein PGT21_000820 [Puccinia graminis f. sp. tritici]|uniref:Uncharacterized protein n=1 Tax=Puccinia graminis f. sp. tritici TaxID=56615 RepID=A0A5B0QDH2_PUCGR|nr:hypothetical protein PGT21_000820 [Puccinia graminis f. sp. tritici]
MVFSQAQDGPTLPTTNPASTGIFSGNQNNPNINIDPPIIPPLLPPPPMRTSHTRVRHYCERYGAHQNNQQNDNPAGSGNTQQTNYPAGTYGLPPDIQEMDEPMPRPAVIIKEPDLRYEGDSGQHITVPIAKIGQGKGWNQMKNLNQVGTAYTKAYQTQDTVQSHFLDGSDFTIKPSLVQRKLKWVKKICHLVKNKTSKEKLCGPNNQLYGTNDGLHGNDEGLHGTDDGLHGTDDGLHGTNNGNSSYNNQTTRSGGRMESGISKSNGHTIGTCTYRN